MRLPIQIPETSPSTNKPSQAFQTAQNKQLAKLIVTKLAMPTLLFLLAIFLASTSAVPVPVAAAPVGFTTGEPSTPGAALYEFVKGLEERQARLEVSAGVGLAARGKGAYYSERDVEALRVGGFDEV